MNEELYYIHYNCTPTLLTKQRKYCLHDPPPLSLIFIHKSFIAVQFSYCLVLPIVKHKNQAQEQDLTFAVKVAIFSCAYFCY